MIKKIKKIKGLLKLNKHTQKQIAEMIDVYNFLISNIKNVKIWKNIVDK